MIKKFLGVVFVLSLVLSIIPLTTSAQTVALPCTITTNLTVGSSGSDVSCLQTFLSSKGFGDGTVTGYFGSLTKSAVASYQASVGISPADGYVGPITRAKINIDMGVVTEIAPIATVVGIPKLKLELDTKTKKIKLVSMFEIKVKAGSNDLNIQGQSFMVNLSSPNNLKLPDGFLESKLVPKTSVASHMSQYGNIIYDIPASNEVFIYCDSRY